MGDTPSSARLEEQIGRRPARRWRAIMSLYRGNQPRTDKDASAGAANASTNASKEPMNTIATLVQRSSSAAPLALAPLNSTSLRDQAYALLKNAIADTDIYDPNQELRLDERQLTTALGVSRTPIREALSLLEQEGFIRTIPRRGIYIIRKSKREMIEMIQMWAALESMAARLATLHATDAEIATLRHLFDEFQNSPPSEHLGEYSDANIAFHTAVIALGGSQTIVDATRNLLIHVRAIRRATITQSDRAARSIIDHLKIIEALERRDTELAERLTRQHTLDLAVHVDRHCDFLD
jgi:DNA-binding GntR family transcriptional regulator